MTRNDSTSPILRVPEWTQRFPWLWHGFSTRAGGVSSVYGAAEGRSGELNLGYTTEDDPERVCENRLRLVEWVSGSRATPLVVLRQIHSGTSVALRSEEPLWKEPPQADGILSDRPGVLLAVQTADCIPVLVADPERRVVATFHAGWRGTVQRIVEEGIARMQAEYGCAPEQLVAAIGPGIGGCCYAVGEELRTRFTAQFLYADVLFRSSAEGELFLELREANRRQLLDAGVRADQIEVAGGCTQCDAQRFFSYRGQMCRTGRMMSVIGIGN